MTKTAPLAELRANLRWTRASYALMSGFVLLILLIMYVWWPLVTEYFALFNPAVPLWRQLDWLLINIFLFMSVMIMAGADIKTDLPIIVVGLVGGLVIESWGTQTNLWHYYTNERPPLWIIPAWPIAALSIDRMVRFLRLAAQRIPQAAFLWLHWLILPAFFLLMLFFVAPTFGRSLTLAALVLCAFLIATPTDARVAVLNFIAGAGLGYYLELWGTTRLTWIYYTLEQPPLFAVLAHGMAAVAFWRVVHLYNTFKPALVNQLSKLRGAGLALSSK
ncbi:MAG: hypothetical protein EPO32_05900 [Anaerolineae bacterium]|nr:MAG: hypothetical protein EPO32_05900 [Anaerolineae bacterium]